MKRAILASAVLGSVALAGAAQAQTVAALVGDDTLAVVDMAAKKVTKTVKVTGAPGRLVGIDVSLNLARCQRSHRQFGDIDVRPTLTTLPHTDGGEELVLATAQKRQLFDRSLSRTRLWRLGDSSTKTPPSR